MRPTNASARAAPSARAVRFYVANKLMDRPEGLGTSATYNYRHFLQLLAIKMRQREGMSLETIRSDMHQVTGDALERRLALSMATALSTGVQRAAAHDTDPIASWRRVPVADGIELHLRDDTPLTGEESIVALREAVRTALGRAEAR
ncbi:MAG: hypothetical protein IPF98_11780 [Gemmatimonadetes bacterium]|nr:hypothetical protein [Gemmatimonadota bacterium]MCC6769584.1 hypothetical protein [Gemmatimonadaceae bacterium]